jgi:hypothetical protein
MLKTLSIILNAGTEHYCNPANQYKMYEITKILYRTWGMMVAILSIGILFVSGTPRMR